MRKLVGSVPVEHRLDVEAVEPVEQRTAPAIARDLGYSDDGPWRLGDRQRLLDRHSGHLPVVELVEQDETPDGVLDRSCVLSGGTPTSTTQREGCMT